jgi:CBS-domain-containing membrane protein
MPCRDIMNASPLTLSPDTTVEAALSTMKKKAVCCAPVTDASGTVMGLFSLRGLMETILPVSMNSESGFSGVLVEAAPGLRLRLQKLMGQSVAVVMERRFPHVFPDAPETQAARLIADKGEGVIVMNENTGRLEGLITDLGVIEGLIAQQASGQTSGNAA